MTSSAHEAGRELLAFGLELAAQGAAQVGDSFTDIPEADDLISSSANAFLLGVLFTQGIPAERAWAGPWLLRQRLGHLDLRRLATEREAVADAFATPPCLHRFKRTLPAWVSDAAALLLERYEGDAARIWADAADVATVSERLSAFPGIGRKKAAMAVEILRRRFRVEVGSPSDGRVAYDVHVRRVFLRTGLVGEDTPAAVDAAAASVCPDAPGTLDLATWLVGREWCRPSRPDCATCRLGGVCARLTDRTVEGVGARPRR